jgi:cob(I)alamin adenosyltransferase
MQTGYLQIYTGDGKGKTTAAIGLAVRAAGHGLRTYFGQFMKGQPYGELSALAGLDAVTVEQYGDTAHVDKEEVEPQHITRAYEGLQKARAAMLSGDYDIVVLDEVTTALWFNLLALEEVLEVIALRPASVELVLTGRRASPVLIEKADLVTDMRELKHYYREGVQARDGIER